MVGVVLAMIGILAAINLYENMIRTSMQTRSDAAQDGQIASSMLTLQLELQSAGFGITKDPAKQHIVRTADGTSLYWRYKTNDFQCKGFRIVTSADNTRRELQLLKLKAGCNDTAIITTFDWSQAGVEVTTLAEFRKSDPAVSDIPVITIAPIATQSCFPYGMGTKANHPLVTITADNAAITAAKKLDAAAVGPNAPYRYDICLPNL
ncbi:MAG: hypothetical protein B0W54_00510 [Cellvibrio sp. 79]|nr:MAG: hypothetical protein B0W54_00510 [Cellvibrio sp. 79]